MNNNQLFNIRQHKNYLVTDELKCHNLCPKYLHLSLTQVWFSMSQSRHSVAVTLFHMLDQSSSNLMNESCLTLNCLKFHQIIHDTTISTR